MTKQFLLAAAVGLAASSAASAALVAGWTVPPAIAAATTGTNFVYGGADMGDSTAGSSLSGFHALAATTWSSPAGNGSTYSFSSNNWSVGDYYEVVVSTVGYTDISLSWDQTRSSTGPSVFDVQMSTDGASFSTILSGYTVIQAGLAGTNTLAWSVANGVQAAFTTTISSIVGADEQSTLYFRFVNTSTVATGGTNRIDNVMVNSSVPAPGAIALLGLAGLASRRRR